ncbi:hypothetical protein VTK26DRAFT_358 [Humicola hyalothermophila]
MPTTEFALLRLSPSESPPPSPNQPVPPGLLPLLASATATQSAWHAAHFPHLPSSAGASARACAWFRQVEDPSWVLTTARWESVDAHWAWIRTEENQQVMRGLVCGGGDGGSGDEGEEWERKEGQNEKEGRKGQRDRGYFAAGDMVLFHVEGGLFTETEGSKEDGCVPLLESPVISVERIFVEKGKKGEFAEWSRRGIGLVKETVSPGAMRFGWREDVEARAEEEEFVVVCGWESVEKHKEAETPLAARKSDEFRKLVKRVDSKHYRRFL